MNGLMLARRTLTNLVRHQLSTNTDRKIFFQNINQTRFLSAAAIMKERIPFSKDFFFRQLFDEKSWTFTYILADINTNEAIIIDPGKKNFIIAS
jgi:hypothetical protein